MSDEDAKLKRDVESLFKKHLRQFASRKKPVKLPIGRGKAMTRRVLEFVDEALQREINAMSSSLSWRKLTSLLVTAATTVTKIREKSEQLRARSTQSWIKSMKDKICSMRSTMSKITAELGRRKANKKPTNKQIRNIRMLKKQYGATSTDEMTSLVNQLGDRLQLAEARLELHSKDAEKVHLRKRFTMKTLDRAVVDDTEILTAPDVSSVRAYWKTIVGRTKPFDRSNVGLQSWATTIKQQLETSQDSQSADSSDTLAVLKRWGLGKHPDPMGSTPIGGRYFHPQGRRYTT